MSERGQPLVTAWLVGVCAESHPGGCMCCRVCLCGSIRVKNFCFAQIYLLIREVLDRNRGDLSATPVCRRGGRITVFSTDVNGTHAFIGRDDLFRSGLIFPCDPPPHCFTEKAAVYNKCAILYYTETRRKRDKCFALYL